MLNDDNGIYIGIFPKKDDSIEYRVIETEAIHSVEIGDIEFQDHMRFLYFAYASSLATEEEAMKEAAQLEKEIGPTTYGIQTLRFNRPLLDKTMEQVQEWLTQKNREIANAQGKVCCSNPTCSATKEPSEQLKRAWFCSVACVRVILQKKSQMTLDLSGVYILQTQTIDAHEWRVALLPGDVYENLFVDPSTNEYTANERILMDNARRAFGKSEVFISKADALLHADMIAQHIQTFFGIISLSIEAIF